MRILDAVQKRMAVDMITLEDCVAFSGLTEETSFIPWVSKRAYFHY